MVTLRRALDRRLRERVDRGAVAHVVGQAEAAGIDFRALAGQRHPNLEEGRVGDHVFIGEQVADFADARSLRDGHLHPAGAVAVEGLEEDVEEIEHEERRDHREDQERVAGDRAERRWSLPRLPAAAVAGGDVRVGRRRDHQVGVVGLFGDFGLLVPELLLGGAGRRWRRFGRRLRRRRCLFLLLGLLGPLLLRIALLRRLALALLLAFATALLALARRRVVGIGEGIASEPVVAHRLLSR